MPGSSQLWKCGRGAVRHPAGAQPSLPIARGLLDLFVEQLPRAGMNKTIHLRTSCADLSYHSFGVGWARFLIGRSGGRVRRGIVYVLLRGGSAGSFPTGEVERVPVLHIAPVTGDKSVDFPIHKHFLNQFCLLIRLPAPPGWRSTRRLSPDCFLCMGTSAPPGHRRSGAHFGVMSAISDQAGRGDQPRISRMGVIVQVAIKAGTATGQSAQKHRASLR